MSALLKKGRLWAWREEQQLAFEALKTILKEAPVLAYTDFGERFTLQTDASESRVSTAEKECLAIVLGIGKLHCYLEEYEFNNLVSKMAKQQRNPTGMIARWV